MTSDGAGLRRGHRTGADTGSDYDSPVAGELRPIGTRPTLVASFDPPGAADAYREWREEHAAILAGVPADAFRVEYGRAAGGGLVVRVRIDEQHLPPGLAS
jgi:hypothetical protein